MRQGVKQRIRKRRELTERKVKLFEDYEKAFETAMYLSEKYDADENYSRYPDDWHHAWDVCERIQAQIMSISKAQAGQGW